MSQYPTVTIYADILLNKRTLGIAKPVTNTIITEHFISVNSHRFSDQSEPNFFRLFGSGFKNEPSPLPEKYRFTRHSFPEYSPEPTRSKRRPAENRFTFKG